MNRLWYKHQPLIKELKHTFWSVLATSGHEAVCWIWIL